MKPGSPGQATLPERSGPAARLAGAAPPAGLLPSGVVPGGVMPGGVEPGGVVPGDVVSGDVVSGDVAPGDVVSGDVVSGDALSADAPATDAPPTDRQPAKGQSAKGQSAKGQSAKGQSAQGQSAGSSLADDLLGDRRPGTPSETDRLLAETLSDAGLPAEGIAVPAEEHQPDGDVASEAAGIAAMAADMAGADHTLDDASAGGGPEVELSEVEVAEVLSGRVIPIGAFFGGDQQAPPATGVAADDDAEQMAGARFLADAGVLVLGWAQERRLGLSSACGICLALSVSAAGWFSAGTQSDIVDGVVALWAGYLVLKAGQWVASPAGQPPAPDPDGASAQIAIIQPTAPGQDASVRGAGQSTDVRPAGPVAWLAVLGGSVAECAVYAGLAVGAAAERWSGVWTLAVAVLGLVAVRNLMSACSTPPGFREQSHGPFRRISEAVLTMPVGGRVLLIGIVAPIWGARVALLAMLEWAIISIGYGIAGRAAPGVADPAARRDLPGQPGACSTLVRLRDDGVLARALGVLVRGSLLPLPPALLGLAAISGLALLGLHGLPGALMIGPAIVMLLAAPGSGHPHTGRFDWLVPVLLLGSQMLYVAAIGVAARVPGPVIFILSSAILLRYADLAYVGRPVLLARRRDPDAEPVERGTAMGWEGRMLFVGLTAAMGLATFAYLALAAYLAVLICTKVAASCLTPEERA